MAYPLETIRRGYKLSGVKMAPRDACRTKKFAKWVAEFQGGVKQHGSSFKIEKLAMKGSKKRAARKARAAYQESMYNMDRMY